MRLIRTSILIALCVYCCEAKAQKTDSTMLTRQDEYSAKWFKTIKATEMVIGFNVQNRDDHNSTTSRQYIELGIAKSIHNYSRHGPASFGMYVSEEMHFGEKNIYGTKIGAYTHYLFDLGLCMVYYTNFKKGNLKLRPELGVGLGGVRIVGGFNVPTVNNKAFEELTKSTGQFTVHVFLPVKRVPIKRGKAGSK